MPQQDWGAVVDQTFGTGRADPARAALVTQSTLDPDQEARHQRTAASIGVPTPFVRDNPAEAQRLLRQRQLIDQSARIRWTAPRTSAFLANTSHAAIAHDDVGVLAGIESVLHAFGETGISAARGAASALGYARRATQPGYTRGFGSDATVRNVGGLLGAGGLTVTGGVVGAAAAQFQAIDQVPTALANQVLPGAGTLNALANALGLKRPTQILEAVERQGAAQLFGAAQRTRPQLRSQLGRDVGSGVESMVGTLAAAGVTVFTRNPLAGAAVLGTTTGGQGYVEARNDGLSGEAALFKGIVDGIIETGTEYFGEKYLGGLFHAEPGSPIRRRLAKWFAAEAGGEQLATLGQDFNQWAMVDANKGKGFTDYLAEIPGHALSTLVATAVTSGAIGSLALGTRAADKAFGGPERRAAAQSAAGQAQLAEIMHHASVSALRERAPDTFEQFVEQASEGSPVQDVYVHPDKLAEVLNQSELTPEQRIAVTEKLQSRIDEAHAAVTDVRVPVSELSTLLAGTPAAEAILPHVRLDPHLPTQAEADAYMQTDQAKALQAQVEEAVDKAGKDEWQREHDEVHAAIKEGLAATNRFTPAVNDHYATMTAAAYATLAARTNTTPKALFDRFPLKVASNATGGEALGQQNANEMRPAGNFQRSGEAWRASYSWHPRADGAFVLEREMDGKRQHLRADGLWHDGGAPRTALQVFGHATAGQLVESFASVDEARAEAESDAASLGGAPEGRVGDEQDTGVYRQGAIGFEVAPDPNDASLTDLWDALPFGAQQRISAEIATPIVVRVGDALGARIETREQLGGYLGSVNVSFAATLDGDPIKAAKAIGFALRQDSVIADAEQPFAGSEPKGAIGIDAATEAEARAIGDKLWSLNEGGREAVIGFSWAQEQGEIVILNTGSLSTEELAGAINDLFGDEQNIAVSERHVAFIGKEDYGYADHKSPASHEGLVHQARAEADRLLAAALDRQQGAYHQSADAPIFYSALERAVGQSSTTKASGQQWLATLRKTGGVKQEEIDWTEIPEWLESQTGAVTKDELLAFVREGGVQVAEVVKGAAKSAHTVYEVEQDFDEENDEPEWWRVVDRNTGALFYEAESRDEAEGWIDNEDTTSATATQFENYTEDGGEDYRELLLTLPPGVGGNADTAYYERGHFADEPVIAHLRFKSRKSTDGKEVMFIEEVQSDWHQKGRERGYADPSASRPAPAGSWSVVAADPSPPDAPFKASWPALAMKRAIRYAVDNGFDQVAWTTGEQQRDRYDLGHTVGSITVAKVGDRFQVHTPQNPTVIRSVVDRNLGEYPSDGSVFHGGALMTVDQIAEVFGKDLGGRMMKLAGDAAPSAELEEANRRARALDDDLLVAELAGDIAKLDELRGSVGQAQIDADAYRKAQRNSAVEINGEDLKIGGEGMLGFYDRNLVNITNKLLKPLGAKVEMVAVADFVPAAPPAEVPPALQERADAARAATGAAFRAAQRAAGTPAHPALIEAWQAAMTAENAIGLEVHDAKLAAKQDTPGTNPGFTITDQMRETARNGFALFQRNLGSYAPATDTITLLQGANLSTFLHESGHFYLELLGRLASDPSAPQQIRGDFDALLKHYGVTDRAAWATMTLNDKRAMHEGFAEDFERYLYTGRAPSSSLREAFRSFRRWLTSVYSRAKDFLQGKQVDPTIAAVMDRLLATDEEIAHQREVNELLPLFDKMPDGTDPALWEAYQRTQKDAVDTAAERLQARAMVNLKWLANVRSKLINRAKRARASTRKSVRAAVEAAVQVEPVYRANTFLRRGLLDGSRVEGPHRLDIAAVDALVEGRPDADAIKARLGIGRYGALGRDGLDPEQVADQFGFSSADHLVTALTAAEPMAEKVDGLTEQRLLENHGDLMDDQQIEEAANAAVLNEAQARAVAIEVQMLNPGGDRALAQAAKLFAEITVGRLRVRDVRPALYEAAARRAGKAAITALAEGKRTTAAAEKRNELFNLYAARAARVALEDAERARSYFARVQRPAALKNMRGPFRLQLQALLDRFDLRTSPSNKQVDAALKPLNDWLQEEAERLSAVLPALPDFVLNGGFREPYRNLQVDQARSLADAVKQLEALARRENKQYLAVKGQAFDAERKAFLDQLRATYPQAFDGITGEPMGSAPQFVPSIGKNLGKAGDNFLGEFLNVETMSAMIDGARPGPAFDSLFSRMSGRSDWKSARLKGIADKLKPLFAAYSVLEKRAYATKGVYVDAIGTSLTRENMLVTALLAGSEDGRKRLQNYGWGPGEIANIVDHLDERDWALADGIWRLFDDDLWPELDALNQRTRGASPPKIAALPYTHRFGVARGGYFRLKYDTELDERAHRFEESAAVKAILGGTLGMSAKTNQGTSTERLDNVQMRPRLDLGVLAETIGETVHDLAYREAVADTMRVLNDKGIQAGIKGALGTAAYRAMVTRVREVAAPPSNPSGFIEKALSVARRNTIVALMTGVKTALQNFTGIVPALSRVSAWHMAKETAAVWSPLVVGRYKFMRASSLYMRSRQDHYDRDLKNGVERFTVKNKLMPDAGQFLILMSMIDRHVTTAVWNAAYRDGMGINANDHNAAVQHADHIVRQTQGSARDVDVARVMSGHGAYGALKKTFTMFYSYFHGQLNQLVLAGAIGRQQARENPAAAVAAYTGRFMAILVVPAVLTELLMHGPGGDDPDKDDKTKRFGHAIAMYLAGMVPGVRDLAPVVWHWFDKETPYYGYKLSPIESSVAAVERGVTSALKDAAGEPTKEQDLKNEIMAAGTAFALPAKLISDTVMGTRAWLDGKAGPEAVILGPPPKKRKTG